MKKLILTAIFCILLTSPVEASSNAHAMRRELNVVEDTLTIEEIQELLKGWILPWNKVFGR